MRSTAPLYRAIPCRRAAMYLATVARPRANRIAVSSSSGERLRFASFRTSRRTSGISLLSGMFEPRFSRGTSSANARLRPLGEPTICPSRWSSKWRPKRTQTPDVRLARRMSRAEGLGKNPGPASKLNPSIAICGDDGFREKLYPSYELLLARRANVSQSVMLDLTPKSAISVRRSVPARGAFRERYERGTGCGGRGLLH
jgi:hypothetical protein